MQFSKRHIALPKFAETGGCGEKNFYQACTSARGCACLVEVFLPTSSRLGELRESNMPLAELHQKISTEPSENRRLVCTDRGDLRRYCARCLCMYEQHRKRSLLRRKREELLMDN